MPTTLDAFLARATGPSRLRAGLRAKTAAVRLFASALGPITSVRAAIPPSVMGGDIFGVFSERLRSLLQDQVPQERAAEHTPRRSAQLDALPIGRPEPFAGLSISRAARRLKPGARLEHGAGAKPRRDPHILPQALGQQDTLGNLPAAPPNSERSTDRHTWQKLRPTVSSSPRARIGPTADGGLRQRDASTSVMPSIFTRKLDEYWDLSQREPARERGVAPHAAGDESANVDIPLPPALDSEPASQSPEIATDEIAAKLRTFISGAGKPPIPARNWQTGHADTFGAASSAQGFPDMRGNNRTLGGADLRGLGDQIAELLREQAIHHGIDLT